ncbi:MAG: hypothetical protein R3D59_05615 [Paracoccaceae bacterium]
MRPAVSRLRPRRGDAALRLQPLYLHAETIIQAAHLGLPIVSVPVEVNDPTRDSRLFRSIGQYVLRSVNTILRIATLYSPLRAFSIMAAILMLPGVLAFVRFLYFYAIGQGDETPVAGDRLSADLAGAIAFVGGLIADLIAASGLLAEIRGRLLKAEQRGTRQMTGWVSSPARLIVVLSAALLVGAVFCRRASSSSTRSYVLGLHKRLLPAPAATWSRTATTSSARTISRSGCCRTAPGASSRNTPRARPGSGRCCCLCSAPGAGGT